MLYTINELHRKIYENVFNVYEVFQNYFGEDFVDLQRIKTPDEVLIRLRRYSTINDTNAIEVEDTTIDSFREYFRSEYPFILVYWPRVTVSNENNRSIDIQELYAKVTLTIDGNIPYEYNFQLNRSRYPVEQFMAGYLHSHIPGIPIYDFTQFQNPCLGTGPIRDTIATLHNTNDEVSWLLFCRELYLYVTVESLTGGPYNRLEYIGQYRQDSDYNGYYVPNDSLFDADFKNYKRLLSEESIGEFVQYYLENGHLQLSFKEGTFVCGMSFFDYIIDISNAFIDYFNTYKSSNARILQQLKDTRVIRALFVEGNRFCTPSNHRDTDTAYINQYIGKHVLYFKGRDITLTIDTSEERQPIITTVLDSKLAMHILNRILQVINYRYTNEYKRNPGGDFQYEDSSTTYQKVQYL